jgi:hypothetical protein
MTLADKVQDKRDKRKQKATDGKQDATTKALEERMNKLERENGETKSRRSSRSRSRRRRRDDSDDETEVAANARRSRAVIERAYEENVHRMGQQYGYGDCEYPTLL